MKITLQEIIIRELTAGYADAQERGVAGYGGKLNSLANSNAEFRDISAKPLN
jgi:hypothetical protein